MAVMADNLTLSQRSYAMSRIRSRGNASTEERLVCLLRAAKITGWRRHPKLKSRPDFVFPKARLAIFVDGCFWHGCPRCFRPPKSNADYWTKKIARNRARDRAATAQLKDLGWHVIRIWEHSFKRPTTIVRRLRRVLS